MFWHLITNPLIMHADEVWPNELPLRIYDMKSYLRCSTRRRRHSALHAASRMPSGRRSYRSQVPGFRCGTGRPRGSPCSSRFQVRSICRDPSSGLAVPDRIVRTAEGGEVGERWIYIAIFSLGCGFCVGAENAYCFVEKNTTAWSKLLSK